MKKDLQYIIYLKKQHNIIKKYRNAIDNKPGINFIIIKRLLDISLLEAEAELIELSRYYEQVAYNNSWEILFYYLNYIHGKNYIDISRLATAYKKYAYANHIFTKQYYLQSTKKDAECIRKKLNNAIKKCNPSVICNFPCF